MPLILEIVTPEKRVFSETVDHVVVPTAAGEIDILPGHIPLISILEPGELKVGQGGTLRGIAIDRGFVQVLGDKVSILAEGAIDVMAIDLTQIEASRAAAEKALEEARRKGEDPAVIEELETKARFAVVQRLIKQR
ncbi:MAG TPA: ATP synthase F1 subunit epsilon [Opitutales bacterium]|nr:ATP synthase F1 subunit epsilon [Opitutales bacterium]